MRFEQTKLCDAWLIEAVPVHDQRGFFARTFCVREYAELGLTTQFVQHSTSHSAAKGTLRGMHFQRAPHGEVKVVGVLRGRSGTSSSIFDPNRRPIINGRALS